VLGPQQPVASTVTVAGVRLARAGVLAITMKHMVAASPENATRSDLRLRAPMTGRYRNAWTRDVKCRFHPDLEKFKVAALGCMKR
jgi:hypothetical protein